MLYKSVSGIDVDISAVSFLPVLTCAAAVK